MSIPQSAVDAYPLADLTAFQRDVLRVVATLGTPHGVAVKSAMEDAWDTDEIHHGRLYPNLDELVESGLIEKRQRDKRTNEYEITARGRRELDAHRTWFNTIPEGDDGE